MSDAAIDNVLDDVLATLQSHRWQTAREIHRRIGRWSHISVRHALRALADENKVESRYDGTIMRPVREYRAWR
jgi:response regulator of citrate/malate metabolism